MALAQPALGWRHAAGARRLLCWGALILAFSRQRWGDRTVTREHDRIQVPAALVAAAGVAPLVIDNEKAVLRHSGALDATLEFQPPAGQA